MHYTPEEVAKLLANRPNQPHYIASLIAECVAAERERCAKLCDDVTVKMNAECPRAVNGWWPDQVGYACIQAIQGPTSAEADAVVQACPSKTPPEAYESGFNEGHAKGVADERAWFVRVLSEWDSTLDVEEILRVRLRGA